MTDSLFILAGHPNLVRALVQVVNADPGLQLVSVSGPPDARRGSWFACRKPGPMI